MLTSLDWIIIALFLLLSLVVGLLYSKRAGKSLNEFFLGGRNLPWYIAGLSMVATTFAADTPLLVTEIVRANGISSNWLWWNMLIGGMLTTFFFARLWRRAEVLTELEFIELRYSGRMASFLRGFKSVYLGLFLNAIVIGWVNFAMMKIIKVMFAVPDEYLIWVIAGLMLLTAFYSSLAGLWGVAVTDSIQFTVAMAGCIILAVIVVNLDEVGGITGLKAQLPESAFSIFPAVGSGVEAGSAIPELSIGFFTFFSYVALQWWASWYPGNEPGGGGYVAQRMMSTRSEKDALYATLFFQIAHYCLRPWPWIIVALCTVILYPELTDSTRHAEGYVMAMRDYLPSGLKGLLLASFLAAYMSTISTQLNWGASFLTNDLYFRFIKKSKKKLNDEALKSQVTAGRIATIIIMLVSLMATTMLETINEAWKFILGCGAGLGMVLILRWYWWRISALSELVATLAPFAGFAFSKFILEDLLGQGFINNNGSFYFTVLFTSFCWILVTWLKPPVIDQALINFYNKVKPDGVWGPVGNASGNGVRPMNIDYLLGCWISAVVFTYSFLFLSGKVIFQEYTEAGVWTLIGLISFVALRYFMKKSNM